MDTAFRTTQYIATIIPKNVKEQNTQITNTSETSETYMLNKKF